ncbi:MAG TPA: hypothetical protein VGZ22_00555, partial [Isosphaeraceae bacterium]|nr:hypothetical protein [Isosphaeraceae bacterium]
MDLKPGWFFSKGRGRKMGDALARAGVHWQNVRPGDRRTQPSATPVPSRRPSFESSAVSLSDSRPGNPYKRVLILSASAGAGHVRSAEAIEHAFRLMGASAEVHNLDTLDYTNPLFKTLYSKMYLDMVNTM